MIQLLTGRALLRNGRGGEARPYLRRAIASDALPQTYLGIATLLSGMAADAGGARDEAVHAYRSAAEKYRFFGRDAARRYQQEPYVERVETIARD